MAEDIVTDAAWSTWFSRSHWIDTKWIKSSWERLKTRDIFSLMNLQIKTVADKKHAPHRKHWHVKQLEMNSNVVFGRREEILIFYSRDSCPSWSNPLRSWIDLCCSITNWNLLLATQKNLIGQLWGTFIFLMTIKEKHEI